MQKKLLDIKQNIFSIISNNAYHTLSPFAKATGFKTSSLCYSERENLYNIAEDFLINSFLRRNDPETDISISSYLNDDGMKLVSLIDKEDLSNFKTIELNKATPLDLSLGETIAKRRSIRDFTGDPVTIKNLTTLLRAANGVSANAEVSLSNGEKVEFNLRTIPSGGGLYPINLYVGVIDVSDMLPGIYRYQPLEDKLIMHGNKNKLQELLQCFSGYVDMVQTSRASVVFFYVARPWRTMRKYGSRGLRFVFQEIGAISQNIHLAVTALGLGSVDCASFYEDEAHRALNFDGINQVVIHSTLVGMTA